MLSIIVPVYNVRLYLEECVDSLLNQSYKNCEIILVDDGSTDGSGEICDSLMLKDTRIKVIHQENGGLPAARNAGLNCAQGKYIAFVDSDDVVSPLMYQDLIEILENYNADVSICNFEVFNREKSYRSEQFSDDIIEYSKTDVLRFYTAALNPCWNRVYRAKPIKENAVMFESKEKVAQEDFWFQVRLFTHITRIATISASHYKYRERITSITKSKSDGDITKRCLDFLNLSKAYISSHSDRVYDDFLNYAYVNMFMASINNAPDTKVSTLKSITKSFSQVNRFKIAISKENIVKLLSGGGWRHKYDLICFSLLRSNLYCLFSFLESLRLKKLRSNNRTDLYYE